MSKLPLIKKIDPIKSSSLSKPIKSKKDDIKSFIDSEIGKFQMKTNVDKGDTQVNAEDNSKSITIMKENMKKIKDLGSQAKINELSKNEEIFKSSSTKFQGFKMPENKNVMSNKTQDETFNPSTNDFLRSTSGANKIKNPFTIKKFEDVTESLLKKEIIDDLNRATDNKKNNFDFEISKENFKSATVNNVYVLPTKQYENNALDDEEYYEDFIDDDELKKIEESKQNNTKINNSTKEDAKNKNKKSNKNITLIPTPIQPENAKIVHDKAKGAKINTSKKEEIMERITSLGLTLEEENMNNMFQMDYSDKSYFIAENLAKGLYKNEMVQTVEYESKSVMTDKIEVKDNFTFTEEYSEGKKNEENNINNNLKINQQISQDKSGDTNLIENTKLQTIKDSNNTQYQPLTLETYKFFIKFSPFVEKIINNNINKYIQQTPQDLAELKAFSKLENEYIISKELINYVNINNLPSHEITFNTYLFFEINPLLIGISLSIRYYDENNISNKSESIFNSSGNNSYVDLIIIYNMFTNIEEKIFYSFSKVTHMMIISSTENIILGCNSERSLDIFDLKSVDNDNKYCQIFENKVNPTYSGFGVSVDNYNKMKFKLKLPTISSGAITNSFITSVRVKLIENSNYSKNKIYKIFILDQEGCLNIYEVSENSLTNFSDVEKRNKFPLRNVFKSELRFNIERLFNETYFEDFLSSGLKCIDMNLSKKNQNSFSEIIYILNNYGLAKLTIDGKDETSLNSIYCNKNEFNKITSFDVSDTGHLVLAFSDFTIKILDENSFNPIFQTCANTLSHDTVLDKIFFANIICKNEKSRLIKKSLIANLYLITSKNEFIIFDMNQKNKSEIKVKFIYKRKFKEN